MTRPRVRFAPSPTGHLHVGGARTALFNHLFARHAGGDFLLRIEDTDRARSSEAMTDTILEALAWLGLEIDEPVVHQADGVERHRRDAQRVLEAGAAYLCFCTPEELEERRAAAKAGEGVAAPDPCRGLDPAEAERRAAAGEGYAVRFAVPVGETSWEDAIHGPSAVHNRHVEDFIVLRSDGTPVYNLAVVSDDIQMGITHVIRGDDHLSNTPKQILLYRALGAPLPVFAHVPMILGPDGKRLSKRHGAASVEAYRERGFLPEAMVNFLALLGWSPGGDREIMSVSEMIEAFTLDRILKKSAVFDVDKLEWMNGQYLARLPASRLAPPLIDLLAPPRGTIAHATLERERDRLEGVIEVLRPRARTLEEMAARALPFFGEEIDPAPEAVRKHWGDAGRVHARLAAARERIARAEPFEAGTLETGLREVAAELEIGAGKLFQPLRVALMGTDRSPGIFDVILLLGRERTLRRLDRALERLSGAAAGAET